MSSLNTISSIPSEIEADLYPELVNYLSSETKACQSTQYENRILPIPEMTEDHNPILEAFLRRYGFSNNIVDIYNNWVECILPKTIASQTIRIGDNIAHFENVVVEPPSYNLNIGNKKLDLTPKYAREKLLSYLNDVFMDIVVRDKNDNEIERKKSVHLCSFPCMVRSSKCHLSKITDDMGFHLMGEDPRDISGYFIMNGIEKVVLIQEKLLSDKAILMKNKDHHVCYITNTLPHTTSMIEIAYNMSPKKTDGIFKMRFTTMKIKENNKKKYNGVNVFTIFRILGIEDVGDIISIVKLFLKKGHEDKIVLKLMNNALRYTTMQNDVEDLVARYQKSQGRKIFDNRADMASKELSDEEKKRIIDLIIERDIFPHLNNPISIDGETEFERHQRILMSKVQVTAISLARILEHVAGYRPLDDRNSWSNKKLDSAGVSMDALFRTAFKKVLYPIANKRGGTVSANSTDATSLKELSERFKNTLITESFRDSFVGVNWGVKGSTSLKSNKVQPLQRESVPHTIGHINTIDVPIQRTDRQIEPRLIHPTSEKLIDCIYTPEGAPCGILKNNALCTIYSIHRDDSMIQRYILGDKNLDLEPMTTQDVSLIDKYPDFVLLNMKPMGWTQGEKIKDYLINLRRSGYIYADTTIYKDDNFVYIETSASRPLRPVFIVNPETQKLYYDELEDKDSVEIQHLFSNGCLELVSASEQETYKIANNRNEIAKRIIDIENYKQDYKKALATYKANPSELNKKELDIAISSYEEASKREIYTHCEIDDITLMGLVSCTIPAPHMNQSPRNVYSGQMSKQSIGLNHSNHRSMHNFPTYKVLQSPVQPMFSTRIYNTIGLHQKGTGENPITGFLAVDNTEEDAWKVSQLYLESGGYRYTKYSMYTAHLKLSDSISERLEKPRLKKAEDVKRYLYIQTGDPKSEGLPYIGAPVKQDDCIIAMVKAGEGNFQIDVSVRMKLSEKGVIDDIKVTEDINMINISVKVRHTRQPQKGDKFAPRNAQKATIGSVIPPWALPYSINGFLISFISSPMSMPSRMTMEYPDEIMAGKVGARLGKIMNGTAFKSEDHNTYRKVLREKGQNEMGEEIMISGNSGNQLQVTVFCGPVHVLALKHNVTDKYQARGPVGKNRTETGQPISGRSVGGGLKFGEMERDVSISHGTSKFAQAMLMLSSDDYQAAFCKCGMMAEYDSNGQKYRECRMCGGRNQIGLWRFPYVLKYYTQLMLLMNIWIRPEFLTQKEYSDKLFNKTLYKSEKIDYGEGDDDDADSDAEEVNLEEDEGLADEIQEALLDDFEDD